MPVTFEHRPVEKPKHNRGKPKRSKRTKFSPKTRRLIIARDGGLCVRCKHPYHNIHHITLASQGGAGEVENGVCICYSCHELTHRDIRVRRWFERYRDEHLISHLIQKIESNMARKYDQGVEGGGHMAFVGIDRDIENHWIYQDAEYFKVWFEILLRSRYSKDSERKLIEGEFVDIEYGEFIFGRISWAKRIGISEKRLRSLFDKLIADGMIVLKMRGTKFSKYFVVNFEKYNKIGHQEGQQSDLTGQWFSDDEGQQLGQQRASRGPAEGHTITKKQSNNDLKPKRNMGVDYTPEFESFWKIYPRKLEKQAAFAKWNVAIKTDNPSTIISCATNYAKSCEQRKTELEYIKHPKTFLNKEAYKDHLVTVVGGSDHGKPRNSAERRDNIYDRLSL